MAHNRKRLFSWRWVLPPLLGLGLLIVLVQPARPPIKDEDFRTKFYKKASTMNLDLLSESSGWLNMDELPLITRLSMTRFTPAPRIETIPALGDGEWFFFAEDHKTNQKYEIRAFIKAHNVIMVAIYYRDGGENEAKILKQGMEKQFDGLHVVVRRGIRPTPLPSASNTNSNN